MNHYALEPAATPRNALVLHLASSLGSPASQIGDPILNFYNAAAGVGFHVLSLAYRNDVVLGARSACDNTDACYPAVRETVITGVAGPGAPSFVADMRADEGIMQRTFAALVHLESSYPAAGWGQFIADRTSANASERISWGSVVATGHSQGGGHAAYLGKLVALQKVFQLSSTCDAVMDTPASWTSAAGVWATSPAERFVGLAAAADPICPVHLAIWNNMGMDPTRMHDDAARCGTGVLQAHSVTLSCVDNFATWQALVQ